jgi:ribosomal protein S12 methylthiotransferase
MKPPTKQPAPKAAPHLAPQSAPQPATQKIGFLSLGCPKNLVDSEVMMGILARNGYELTARADEADVLVVNTCSFIAPAQQESVDTIIEMAEHKKFGRAHRLVVAGCLAERFRDQIREQIPEVDAVIGTGEVEQILEAVRGDMPLPAAAFAKDHALDYLYHDASPRLLSTPRHQAYIKIAEGCDHPCTFCIIPQLRGKFRSRRFESVVREAQNLADSGVREITLIGQDTTSYGEDLNLRDGLAALLARLADVEGLTWVRFLYAYPNRVTQGLLDTLAEHPRLAKYMDMPLQHASRRVLASMKRGSSGAAFLQLLDRIRDTIPGVMLRTSFIVGFPGETDSDFRELCDFVRAAEFDWMGVFPYSDVDNAASFALENKVDADTINDRRNHLMAIQQKISARRLRRFIGQQLPALVEGPSKDSEFVWEARLQGMAPEIDGKLYLTDLEPSNEPSDGNARRQAQTGDMATVEITESHDYDLVGRIVRLEQRFPLPTNAANLATSSVTAANAVQKISTGAALRVLA